MRICFSTNCGLQVVIALRKKLSSSQQFEIDIEMLIQEHMHIFYLKETMDELNESIERNKIKRKIREDICMLAFRKTAEEFNKMMTSCKVDNIIVLREQIDQIVFEETLKDFVNISSYASIYHRKNINVQDNCSTMILNQVQKVQVQGLYC